MTDIEKNILEIKEQMGEKLLILGHHYQRSSVLQYCDKTGDSLELARYAGRAENADKIVFAGVRFMAESADILSGPGQTVFMPEPLAGCPMAQMADAEQMNAARVFLQSESDDWLPVVYVNSTAAIKSCCGDWGGSTCTSSNAQKVFEWAGARGKRVFFLPDEHLGWNTAHDMGVSDDEILLYDPAQENGGLTLEQVAAAKVIVWKGFCIVHQRFSVEQVEAVRENIPEAKIIIHPEAPKEVVRLCDAHGSTSQIISYIEEAPEGSTVVVGTEVNLVERMAEIHKDRVQVLALTPSVCSNMAKTNVSNLLDVMSGFPAGSEVHVSDDVAANARLALERMLEI